MHATDDINVPNHSRCGYCLFYSKCPSTAATIRLWSPYYGKIPSIASMVQVRRSTGRAHFSHFPSICPSRRVEPVQLIFRVPRTKSTGHGGTKPSRTRIVPLNHGNPRHQQQAIDYTEGFASTATPSEIHRHQIKHLQPHLRE